MGFGRRLVGGRQVPTQVGIDDCLGIQAKRLFDGLLGLQIDA